MVKVITNLGRSGLSDWLMQRVSGVILAAYAVFIVSVLLGSDVTYASWQALFSKEWVRIFSLLAVLSLAAHAWVGMWTVITDYIRPGMFPFKPDLMRFILQVVVAIALFSYVIVSVRALWGA